MELTRQGRGRHRRRVGHRPGAGLAVRRGGRARASSSPTSTRRGAGAWPAEIGARALGVGCDVADEAAGRSALDRRAPRTPSGRSTCSAPTPASPSAPTSRRPRTTGTSRSASTSARTSTPPRRSCPGWLERGEGYFLTTASAAGLLTQIGSAPYAVTKHAAVAFAEWLSVTYGDRGRAASAACARWASTRT